ncbi:hypothetical protein [Halosegnis marinus]|uniref:hypothetical protein n=1 Tax=Halosegnis marinus TaxID=3034023 RepID=UPI0036203E4C
MGEYVDLRSGADGLTLVDPAMNARMSLGPVGTEPTPVPPRGSRSRSTTRGSSRRGLGTASAGVVVRDDDGEIVCRLTESDGERFGPGRRFVELSGSMKVYVRIAGPFEIRTEVDDASIVFDAPSRVRLGVRSYHETPTGTVTTTPDPEGLAWAVSRFGGAIKTDSPDRSYPTLRGHPPRLRIGNERSVRGTAPRARSETTVAVEPTTEAVMTAAPLAYYLGAPLVTGSDPRVEVRDAVFPSRTQPRARSGC